MREKSFFISGRPSEGTEKKRSWQSGQHKKKNHSPSASFPVREKGSHRKSLEEFNSTELALDHHSSLAADKFFRHREWEPEKSLPGRVRRGCTTAIDGRISIVKTVHAFPQGGGSLNKESRSGGGVYL